MESLDTNFDSYSPESLLDETEHTSSTVSSPMSMHQAIPQAASALPTCTRNTSARTTHSERLAKRAAETSVGCKRQRATKKNGAQLDPDAFTQLVSKREKHLN